MNMRHIICRENKKIIYLVKTGVTNRDITNLTLRSRFNQDLEYFVLELSEKESEQDYLTAYIEALNNRPSALYGSSNIVEISRVD